MSVNVSDGDGVEVTIHVAGRFDFGCHKDFVDAYKDYPKGEKRFVVDLSSTEYMDSSAMGMLLQLREFAVKGDGVVLKNAQEGVKEILAIAKFDRLFKVV